MPAPKDPEKRKKWRENISKSTKGRKPWNFGLTKETDLRVKKQGEASKGNHFGAGPHNISKEGRENMRRAGQNHCWIRGLTKETDLRVKKMAKNISRGRKGMCFSEEHIENLRKSHKNIPLSLKHRKAIGKALEGRTSWCKGLTKEIDARIAERSEKTIELWKDPQYRETVTETHRGHSVSPATEWEKGHIPWNKNKPWSEEKKQEMKANWTAEMTKKSLRRHIPSSLEKRMIEIIQKHNLPYKFTGDGSFIIGRCNPDFINVDGDKIAVEVYARYFKEKDGRSVKVWKRNREQVFEEYGWKIAFFSEAEVREELVIPKLLRVRHITMLSHNLERK